ncbi:MAG: glycosyltransferase family 4 protein [Nanoarchaeota archaeon]|nr:glycosyltransferase family 4 protein [Nanoarchaeota archaeon]
MKILIVTAFSAGFDGLWARIEKETELLAGEGHEVYVFSSNIKRGSGEIEYAPEFEEKKGVKIYRFKTYFHIGQNTFFWNYTDRALKLYPDIIICHAYRQYYSTVALKIANRLKIPCILVTHAPFLEKGIRDWKLDIIAWLYDRFVGRRILNKYSKIFTITKWEIPYLLKLGVKKENIIYMPNGIPEEFFKIGIKKPRNKLKKILFLGRVAPVKDIGTLIRAVKLLEKEKIILELVGPVEEEYGEQIKNLIHNLSIENKIKMPGPVCDLGEKINIIDSCDVFVLPSKREGMPQSLVEAMAREKIVISSNTQGGKEIIKDKENGYLFQIGNESELAEKISLGLQENDLNKQIAKQARKSVERFSWDKLIKQINNVLIKEVSKKK